MSAAIDIDPDGDVILACNSVVEHGSRLRVSSKALSLGSPVFKSMLSQKFKEGSELAQHAVVEIPLPEDDSSVIEVLCNVLHLRNDTLVKVHALSSERIMLVAQVSDKYECREALGLAAVYWLPKPNDSCTSVDASNLLVASYYLRNEGAIREYGRALVLNALEPICDPACACPRPLPELFGLLENECLKLRRCIIDYIEEEVEMRLNVHRLPWPESVPRCNVLGCRFGHVWAGNLLLELQNKTLWPTREVAQQSVKEMLAHMGEVEDHGLAGEARGNDECRYRVKCLRKDARKGEFAAEATRIRGTVRDLCSRCYIANGSARSDDCPHAETTR